MVFQPISLIIDVSRIIISTTSSDLTASVITSMLREKVFIVVKVSGEAASELSFNKSC